MLFICYYFDINWQERKFNGGSQLISERIAKSLGGTTTHFFVIYVSGYVINLLPIIIFPDSVVIKNRPVIEINQQSEECVAVKTLDGLEYKVLLECLDKCVILLC